MKKPEPTSVFTMIQRGIATILGLFALAFGLWQLTWSEPRHGDSTSEVAAPETPGAAAIRKAIPVPEDDSLVIVLDPGHGGRDGGAVAGGHMEKVLNLDIVVRIRHLLEANGQRVILTRSGDQYVGLQERTEVANQFKNVLFVSIHQNTAPSESAEGVETYYAGPKPASVLRAQRRRYALPDGARYEDERSRILAERVQVAFCEATSASDRGVRNRNLVVTRWVHGPSILVECGFISNPKEAARIKDERYRDKIAVGVVRGIMSYVNESGGDHLYGLVFDDGEPSLVQASPTGS